MDGQRPLGAEPSRRGAGVAGEPQDPRPNGSYARSGEGRTTPRKPTPLQVSETPSWAGEDSDNTSEKEPYSPFQTIYPSENAQKSPRTKADPEYTEPKSPRDRLGEFLAVEDPTSNGKMTTVEQKALRNANASPTKSSSYSQLRNASSPLPDLTPMDNSSPPSPRTTASPHFGSTGTAWARPGLAQNARTSSIDSAISSINVLQNNKNGGHSPKEAPDMTPTSHADISNLIRVAGSPEAAIQHLLKKEKSNAARVAQLWEILGKQRSLIHELNKDLDRALEDKERYKKKLKDLDKPAPLATVPKPLAPQPRAPSRSPESDSSVELPMQKQSEEPPGPPLVKENEVKAEKEINNPAVITSDRVNRSWPKPSGPSHTHTKTSSSDLNALGPFSSIYGVTPIQTRDLDTPAPLSTTRGPQTPPSASSNMSPTSSFTAKRSVVNPLKTLNGGNAMTSGTSTTPIDSDAMSTSRKLPPAPLNLGNSKPDASGSQYGPDDHSDSEYDDAEVEELVDRGRKKTREDDDKERQVALLKEKEERSRSMKDKASKSRSGSNKSKSKDNKPRGVVAPMPASVKGLSPESQNIGAASFSSQPASIAGLLQPQIPQNKASNVSERTINAMPLSPGLPMSPRPTDRPINQPPPTPRLPRDGPASSMSSPPLSPRPGVIGLPLSPRAPRQQIPFPPHTPMSMAPTSPMPTTVEPRKDSGTSSQDSGSISRAAAASHNSKSGSGDSTTAHQSKDSRTGDVKMPGVFSRFMSESYPKLLIPPNALPSIKIKVVSSRLKPSRNSLILKGADDEPVFTLGISARSDFQDLWQLEKSIVSLQQLDLSLRQCPGFNIKVPSRSLFKGAAPAKIDARREALENYFEAVLDTQLDERAAVALCKYLSTNVLEPESRSIETNGVAPTPDSASSKRKGSDGRPTKEGQLSKCGKTFGNWIERYFVLNSSVLEYYDLERGRKSGPLGKINLHNAQIGTEAQKDSSSPSRNGDHDGQYRHTFLIKEPKRKDPSSFIDHVLCAESDDERDAWVTALLCYVDGFGSYSEKDGNNRPNSKASGGSTRAGATKKSSIKDESYLEDSPESENFDTLQTVPYEETQVAQAPHVAVVPDLRSTETPSPTNLGMASTIRAPSAQSKAISAPQNGAKISDVQAWGNKPMASPLPKPAEPKKRGRWGFRENKTDHGGSHQGSSSPAMTQQQQEYQEHATNVKAVFKIPLSEAVEYCAPRGVDVCLPAVVYRCLEYLEAKNAAAEEGIFRLSGSLAVIKQLQQRFNSEGDYDLLGEKHPFFEIHSVASLLKLYLRELPGRMLSTRDLHMQFLSVLELKEESRKIAALNILVHRLPKPNYCLLRALTAFLITIVDASDVNLMDARNICIVFSPTLDIPGPLIGFFLSAFDEIFERHSPLEASIPQLEVTASTPDTLTPEDIRSPRRQMFSDPIPTPSYNQDSFGGHSMNAMLANDHHQQQRHPNNQVSDDTGFIPMQPTYEQQNTVPFHQTQEPGTVTVPGPEYAIARPRNLPPGGSARSRRRESSMLLMNPAPKSDPLSRIRDDEDGE